MKLFKAWKERMERDKFEAKRNKALRKLEATYYKGTERESYYEPKSMWG
jgi:hypothetical protein